MLKDSRRASYNASHLCSLIKDFDGKPLSVYEQRDADEFFNLLMDRLESGLKTTNKPKLIQEVFGGAFANEIISQECDHRSEGKEDFLTLNIQIQNKKSLHDSLQAFIEGESLTGANAYNCEKCNKKVSAKKRSSFGILPNTLIIVLKRFEFDLQKK